MKRFHEEPPRLDEPWTLGDLRAHWELLLGPALASICRPSHVGPESRFLFLRACSVAWCQELWNLSDIINRRLPGIVDGVQLHGHLPVLDRSWQHALEGVADDDDDSSEAWKR